MIRTQNEQPHRRGNAVMLALGLVALLSLLMVSIAESALATVDAVREVRHRHQAELAAAAFASSDVDTLTLPGNRTAVRVDGRAELRDAAGRILAAAVLPDTTPVPEADE